MSMRCSEIVSLVRGLTETVSYQERGADPHIVDVSSDSRAVSQGALFCCIKGEEDDGHGYVGMAEERGAVALLCERPVASSLPTIIVPSVREVMGEVAAAVHGDPSKNLFMVGVTGTNGKTTTTYAMKSILQAAGIRTGLLGTIVESDGLTERDADRTTPESCVVQRQLAAMVKNGCGACVMETSSHGLSLGRLRGARFDVPVFTNLHPEHLDFHGDMEGYFQAKRLLFLQYVKHGSVGAANATDPYGRRLLEESSGRLRGFSLDEGEGVVSRAVGWQTSLEGTTMKIEMEGHPPLDIKSPLVGVFNVWNVLCAVTASRGRVDDAAILQGIASMPQVPGRVERHALPNGACCFIDFAHTPSALRSVLSTLRSLSKGRAIAVFGHGGGRYPMNRPELGKVAAELADEAIFTMDNPRDEDPGAIAHAIEQGFKAAGGTTSQIILDRGEAIRKGLGLLGPGDVLVVTGKGPEKYVQIGDVKHPFSDAETVERWIREEGRRP